MSDRAAVTPVPPHSECNISCYTIKKQKSIHACGDSNLFAATGLKTAAHYLQIPNRRTDGVNTEENLARNNQIDLLLTEQKGQIRVKCQI